MPYWKEAASCQVQARSCKLQARPCVFLAFPATLAVKGEGK
jgi:hypothetical protein